MRNNYLHRVYLLLLILLKSITSFSQPGNIDTTFHSFGTFNGPIYTSQLQTDGKLIVAGDFTYYGYKKTTRIARLNQDGSLDDSFKITGGPNAKVNSIKIQPDGKILVAGEFSKFNEKYVMKLVRLNSDGSIDTSFTVSTANSIVYSIYSVKIQTDNKIIIAGDFYQFNNVRADYIARLHTGGVLDTTFKYQGSKPSFIEVQTDDYILVALDLTNGSLKRLGPDGNFDNTFVANNDLSGVKGGRITDIQITTSGQIYISGFFTQINNLAAGKIALLNSDGSLDATYVPDPILDDHNIWKIKLLADFKLLCYGRYGTSGTEIFCRLNTNGSLDRHFSDFKLSIMCLMNISTIEIDSSNRMLIGAYRHQDNVASNTFIVDRYFVCTDTEANTLWNYYSNTSSSGYYSQIIEQQDGKYIVSGPFKHVDGIYRPVIARLLSNGKADPSFNCELFFYDEKIYGLAIQNDGKILVAGNWIPKDGRSGLLRLNTDGSIDNTFPKMDFEGVRYVHVLDNNKFLVTLTSTSGPNFFRYNANGTLDDSFLANNKALVKGPVLVQQDGCIIVAGNGMRYNLQETDRIIKLKPNGSIDSSFKVTSQINIEPDFEIKSLFQHGSYILVSAMHTSGCYSCLPDLFCLSGKGAMVKSFKSSKFTGTIARQENGKILLIESFYSSSKGITRLNSDGSLDNSFGLNVKLGMAVYDIIARKNGQIIVIGAPIDVPDGPKLLSICKINSELNAYNTIRGKIFLDENEDCTKEETETVLENYIVTSLPDASYASVVGNEYVLKVDTGSLNHNVTQILNPFQRRVLTQNCPSTGYGILLSGTDEDTCCFNFANKAKNCVQLSIDVQSNRRRRCFRNYTTVLCSNDGVQDVADAQVHIICPEYLIPLGSSIPWTSKTDSLLTFNLGTISAGERTSIIIYDSIACVNGITGLDQCLKAWISPANNCETDILSDMSKTEVTGYCDGNNAKFTITNSGTGNMSDSLAFSILVNDTLITEKKYKLNSGSFIEVSIPVQGETVMLEAEQNPYHPTNSSPKYIITGCGLYNNSFFVSSNNLPVDDLDEQIHLSCLPVIDSYDPNNKEAIPHGITKSKYISPGTEINYIINFQNEGTDTAYTVIIVDTLDTSADLSSFVDGASSHPYVRTVSGSGKPVITWTLSDINLPSKQTNEEKSMGFVKFKIKPGTDIEGSTIENKAHIYFDFNLPIETNSIVHTISNYSYVFEDLETEKQVTIVTANKTPKTFVAAFSPNPFTINSQLSLNQKGRFTISLYDISGNERFTDVAQNGKYLLERDNLPPGFYIYKIINEYGVSAAGKLIIQK